MRCFPAFEPLQKDITLRLPVSYTHLDVYKRQAQGLSLPIINDNVALLGTPDDRAAILAVSETSVRVSQSVSPLLFSIISMKWLWDGAYASGFAVGILILLVAFFLFEPRTVPSKK